MSRFSSFRSGLKRILNKKAHEPENAALKADIPGMVSPAEIAFFRESAALSIGKEGAIVDLGCWLGSTSIALAQGILGHDSGARDQKEKVFGFDLFIWEEWMPAQVPYCLYQPGDSFLAEARRLARDHGGGAIELIRADLALYEWQDGPIKILLVDAMKNESIAGQISRTFYPDLPAGGLLIHQDFKHYYTSWIHVLQYRLREYFRLDRSVLRSATVAFEVLAPIPKDAVDRATDFSTVTNDEIEASFRYSIDLVGPGECTNVAAAHAMHYVHLGRTEKASAILEIYRSLGMLNKGEFPIVLHLLDQMKSRGR